MLKEATERGTQLQSGIDTIMTKKKKGKNSYFELSMFNNVRDTISLEEIENTGKFLHLLSKEGKTDSVDDKKFKEKEAEE